MTGIGIDDLARRLAESLPAAVTRLPGAALELGQGVRQDLERNFRAILQATLGKLDLNTRTEFDIHTRLLERTRLRVAQLEARVAELEKLQAGGMPPNPTPNSQQSPPQAPSGSAPRRTPG